MGESSTSVSLPALADNHRRFLEARRVAHLATADAHGRPHVVPVCFAVSRNRIYITMDDKPKQTDSASLKRLRNIAENPAVALVADRYDDDRCTHQPVTAKYDRRHDHAPDGAQDPSSLHPSDQEPHRLPRAVTGYGEPGGSASPIAVPLFPEERKKMGPRFRGPFRPRDAGTYDA